MLTKLKQLGQKTGTSLWSSLHHFLAKHNELLPSGRRLRVTKSNTARRKQSFVLQSIAFLNR